MDIDKVKVYIKMVGKQLDYIFLYNRQGDNSGVDLSIRRAGIALERLTSLIENSAYERGAKEELSSIAINVSDIKNKLDLIFTSSAPLTTTNESDEDWEWLEKE